MKTNSKFISLSVLAMLFLSLSVLAPSLPTQGGNSDVWGTSLNNWLLTAHNADGTLNIGGGAITSTMILDLTITAADLASGSVNTTAILDQTITFSDIAVNTINGSNIATTAQVNVTSMVVAGSSLNVTNASGTALAGVTNVTGIFMNYTRVDVVSLAISGATTSSCQTIYVNMTGLPVNAWCLPLVDPSMVNFNLTVTGTNSTSNNCRLLVCNPTNLTINPPELTYGAIAFTNALNFGA